MLSKYFELKTDTEEFKTRLEELITGLKDKKVILYGVGQGFLALREDYDFSSLNIVAVADKKFSERTKFENILAIPPEQIVYQDYDVILVTNENPCGIVSYLKKTMLIEKDIETIFKEDIPQESSSYNYLQCFNFDKRLDELNKKLKNKSIVIYGAGVFFEAIKKFYDLSKLNIIGIADKRFACHAENEEFLGYKAYNPDEIKDLKPDYVLVATKFYIGLIEDLHYKTLKGVKTKIKPLLKKDLATLIKEVWN